MQNLKLIDYTKKRLDDMYVMMYTIKNDLNIKKGDIIESIDIYTLIGINKKGIRQLVGIYQDRPLNNRYWLDIFESLKTRGLNTILFVAIDDNKNFKRTVKIAFPMVNFVDSLIYISSKFDKYTSEKCSRKVMSRIHRLYSQPTMNELQNEFKTGKYIVEDEQQGAHRAEYGKSVLKQLSQKLIEKYLVNVEGYYKYSSNIRNLLFKPSANTRIYDRIRLSFNSTEKYISDLNEIYEKLRGVILDK